MMTADTFQNLIRLPFAIISPSESRPRRNSLQFHIFLDKEQRVNGAKQVMEAINTETRDMRVLGGHDDSNCVRA